MNHPYAIAKFSLVHWIVLPALCTVHCVESDRDDGSPPMESQTGGAGGLAGETPSQAGLPGPVLICGRAAEIGVCDPLSAKPCPSGATCDFSNMMGGFKCFEDAEPAGAGETCDNETKFCGPGLYCETRVLMVCQHYCCDDSDCEFGACYGSDLFFQDGESTVGACYDEFGGFCELAEPGEEPEECLGGAAGASSDFGSPSSAGAGGSAP